MSEYHVYCTAPTITMIVLKLIGKLTLGWLWVFSPLILPALIFFVVSILTLVFLIFSYILKNVINR